MFGAAAFLFPLLTFLLSWKWIRSEELEAGGVKIFGSILLTLALSAALSFVPLRLFGGNIRIGGTLGLTLANYLVDSLNVTGALVITLTAIVISIYLVSTFTLATLAGWLAGPSAWFAARGEAWRAWRERAHQRAIEKAKAKSAARRAPVRAEKPRKEEEREPEATRRVAPLPSDVDGRAPWETRRGAAARGIRQRGRAVAAARNLRQRRRDSDLPGGGTGAGAGPVPRAAARQGGDAARSARIDPVFRLPPTDLLNEAPARNPYDEQELKDIAGRIKSKFEEFNVLGIVVQINPGPVVTTFEFKPEAGIKYSRITTLTRRPLPRPAGRIDPDRAHSRQADRRHRSAEHQARSDQPAPDSGIGRVPEFALAPDHLAGQGHQRPHQSGGARIHAAPADRRLHRLGQERDDQLA